MPLDEWTARLVKLQHMNRFHNVRDLLGLYKNFPPALGAFKHRKPKQPLATELEQNPDILQQRTTPSYIVWMYGWGVRVGYYVPYPTLYTVGGTGAVPAGRGYFEQWVGANWGGYPVYCARWAIPFRLLQPPKNAVGVPQNPALLVRG